MKKYLHLFPKKSELVISLFDQIQSLLKEQQKTIENNEKQT